MAQGAEINELVDRCQRANGSGFEAYIYSLEPSPLGQPGFFPAGTLNLKRVFHVYDAHEEFVDEANSIINKLSSHSEEASRAYLAKVLELLHAEQQRLAPVADHDNTTTGA
jgi:hypothetical protein